MQKTAEKSLLQPLPGLARITFLTANVRNSLIRHLKPQWRGILLPFVVSYNNFHGGPPEVLDVAKKVAQAAALFDFSRQ
jgi:hypothetical protein